MALFLSAQLSTLACNFPALHSPVTSLFPSSYMRYCHHCGFASESIRGVADLCSAVCHCSAEDVDTNTRVLELLLPL